MRSLLRDSSKEYLVRSYDKHHELLDEARTDRDGRELLTAAWARTSAGLLRFELQLRAPLLRRKGLTRMTDLTPDVVDDLARDDVEHARSNDPYGGVGRVQAALATAPPLAVAGGLPHLCSYRCWTEHGMEVDLSRNVLDRCL